MADFAELLAVQELDSSLDAITNRRPRLAERAAHADAVAQLKTCRQQLAVVKADVTSATGEVEALEHAGAARSTKKERLQKQLKTVIAPREAEALMHEIALIDAEASESDDRELELLDLIEAGDVTIATTEQRLAECEAHVAATRQALADAEATLDAEAADVTSARNAAASALKAGTLARYEAMRATFKGIGIARLVASHCSGCHLDLSRTFVEHVRLQSGDEPLECEQCGRWLVA